MKGNLSGRPGKKLSWHHAQIPGRPAQGAFTSSYSCFLGAFRDSMTRAAGPMGQANSLVGSSRTLPVVTMSTIATAT